MYRYYFRRGISAFITLGKIFVIIILIVHLLPVFTQAYFFAQHLYQYVIGMMSQLQGVLGGMM